MRSRARRRLLQGLAALGGCALAPQAVAQPLLAPGDLSRPLTGFTYDDPAVASAMLRAMTAAFGVQPLQRIAAIASSTPAAGLSDALRNAGLADVAQRVIVALYSGTVVTAQGPVVFAYNDALGWRAVPWTKPNAVCGGPTDYWASAPSQGS
jgi:hypothetical protein